MGISRTTTLENKDKAPVVNIIEKITAPIIHSSKKYWIENPKDFLGLFVVFIFLILTFVGEIFIRLPWMWYAVFLVLVASHFDTFTKIKTLIKKK